MAKPVYNDEDYLKGRVELPSDVNGLPSRPGGYPERLFVANGLSDSVDIFIEDGAHFLVREVKILSSLQTALQDKAKVQITDSGSSRSWSNKPVPLRDLAGVGCRQKFLAHPNLVFPNSNVTIQITNNTGTDAWFDIHLNGDYLYNLSPERAALLVKRQWYQYVLTVSALAAGAIDEIFKVQVDTKADFFLHRILSSELWRAVVGAAAGAQSSEIYWNLVNSNGDVPLWKGKTSARLTMGQIAGEYFNNAASFGPADAFALKRPWLARRGSLLKGFFDNQSADPIAAPGVDVVLEGIKIFPQLTLGQAAR